MSWDLYLYDFPKDAKSVEDVPDDWVPPSFATLADVTAKIRAVGSQVTLSASTQGEISGPGYFIDFRISADDDRVTSVSLFVRGSESSVPIVSAIISALGVRAVDTGTGGFFESGPQEAEGYRHWAAYRDRVIGREPS